MPKKRRSAKPAKKEDSPKPGVSRKTFRTSPAFKKSRLAAGDFGRASQCAVLIRRELVDLLEIGRQHNLHRKLSQMIIKLLQEERASGAERIRLNQIRWKEFEKKDFNEEAGLGTLLYDTPGVRVDPALGKIELLHPSFHITPKVMEMEAVTHVRIIAGAAAIDFDKKKASHDYAATDYFSKGQIPEGSVTLSMQVAPQVAGPLFVVMGLETAKEERDKEKYVLGNRRYKALKVVLVQPAPPPAYRALAPRPAKKTIAKKSAAKPKSASKSVKKNKPIKKKKK